MAKKQGKIKAIPVKEVTEGMQVVLNSRFVCKVISIYTDGYYGLQYIDGTITSTRCIEKTKTLVVEYEDLDRISALQSLDCEPEDYNTYKQIPLKYSQWESALDNGEVDSDKVVEFEIKGLEVIESDSHYAKVIPQKKRIYTRNEVEKLIMKYALDQHSIVCSPELGNWIKENLK